MPEMREKIVFLLLKPIGVDSAVLGRPSAISFLDEQPTKIESNCNRPMV